LTSSNLVDPRDLIEMLNQHPLTAPFNLALYSEENGRKGLVDAIHDVCSPLEGEHPPCIQECYKLWEETTSQALMSNQPVVSVCPQGALCLSIPLPANNELPDCLLGGGVFEQGFVEHSANDENKAVIKLGDESISTDVPQLASRNETEAVSEEIFRALPRLLDQQVSTLGLSRTTQRLEAVQKLARDLTTCDEREKAIEIVSEALVVLFNLPRILIVLQQPGQTMSVHSTLGLDPQTFQFDQSRLSDYFSSSEGTPEVLSEATTSAIFHGLEARSAHLYPLKAEADQMGAIIILDVELHARDQALIELLVSSLSTRLEKLKTVEGHRQERQFSARLVSMISKLSLVDNRQELYEQILEMSTELLTATSGSLMLLNETDGTLAISAAKGMTESLAKTMVVPYGEGIAGRVAKSGFPMLVNDIERDKRVSSKNRPRFKTKSFISLPLETEDRLIGVLNLADKSNGGNFSEADLNLIQTFTGHAVLMIDRAATLEKAGQFEQLAITDPLTGLYNRRFLENRLQEEFNRSSRQKQDFCIILADLDNFKIYNDICGHLAGDKVLRKAAQLMRNVARDMDIVTRFGGEEFCFILPATSKKEAVFVGERMRRIIETESFPGENHLPQGRLTTSVGIASFPNDGATSNELIHAADMALYHAKSLGRNRLILYEPTLENKALKTQN
jgi:diguanylate cyclase (GGDEF)-like protein